MAFVTRGDTTIYYEKIGNGFPVVAIAPGGLRSAIEYWDKVHWDPVEYLGEDFSIIMLDLRTAGRSSTVITETDGWAELESDIIAVLDDAQVEKAHCIGMCIGGAFVIGLMEHYPDRFLAGVPIQPIGLHNNMSTFQAGWGDWAADYHQNHPEVDLSILQKFTQNLLEHDFLFNGVTREQVSKLTNPLLILEGDDDYHPREISQELAHLAPHAELITDWKTHPDIAKKSVKEFLVKNTPA